MDKMLDAQRSVKDKTGLGYNDVPPPFNSNYTKTPVDIEMTEANPETKVTNKSDKSEAQKNVITNPSSDNSKNIPFTKVQFVSSGVLNDTKTDDAINKEQKIDPLVPKTQTENAKVGKSRKQMSCFKCHQKGHVASCCPNKKLEASHKLVINEKTPINSSSIVDRLGTKPGLGSKPVNILKRDGSHSVSPPKPKRPYTLNDNTFNKPRDKTPSRFRTPSRYHSQYESGSTSRAHGFNSGYDYNIKNRTHDSGSRRFSSNSPLKTDHHPQAQASSKVTKAPDGKDGYFKELKFVDDKGQTKTVMAWVPLEN